MIKAISYLQKNVSSWFYINCFTDVQTSYLSIVEAYKEHLLSAEIRNYNVLRGDKIHEWVEASSKKLKYCDLLWSHRCQNCEIRTNMFVEIFRHSALLKLRICTFVKLWNSALFEVTIFLLGNVFDIIFEMERCQNKHFFNLCLKVFF